MIFSDEHDLQKMRTACQVAATVLEEVAGWVRPGITTKQLDEYAAARIKLHGARSAFLNYRKYPCNICISVNEEIVHGLASDRRLLFGDIVSIDVGVLYNGYIGDNARTVPVGGCDPAAQKLIDVTEKALYEGISQAVAGRFVSDISRAVQTLVESNGFSVVREFVGHGVGKSVHEDPQVPNFVDRSMKDVRLVDGMTIAIEPMVNAGKPGVRHMRDGWTVVTADRQLSAHAEHTVLVRKGEPEILTWPAAMPSGLKV